MIIRNMIEADLDEVFNIEVETFSLPWTREDFFNALRDDNNQYYVSEIEGNIAGYCGYWGVVGEGYITNVAVKSEYRRRQVGKAMLSHMLLEGETRGITSFTLEVRQSNEPAIRLYEQLGFENEGIRKDFYSKPDEDAFIMWLRPIQ